MPFSTRELDQSLDLCVVCLTYDRHLLLESPRVSNLDDIGNSERLIDFEAVIPRIVRLVVAVNSHAGSRNWIKGRI